MTFHKRKDYGARVRIWDNGGKTADRYTILPPANAGKEWQERAAHTWQAICSNAEPFHPQGIGMHVSAVAGAHLGKRIHWDALPADVQKFARQAFPGFCPDISQPAVAQCQDCRAVSLVDALLPIVDLSQRVDEGEPMPAGECPHCRALAHEIERKDIALRVLSIDAWREGEGWQWNNWSNAGEVPARVADMKPRQLLRYMRGRWLAEFSKGKLAIEDDGHNVVIIQRHTREPLYAIEYGSLHI